MKKEEIFNILNMDPPKRGGEKARLFPVLSETSKEGRAASIFLACLSLIPEFANKVLSPLGRSVGKRSKVYCVTEIEFDNDKNNRPDGLIGVKTGSSVWRSLVEFKVGGLLEKDQVERYLKVARNAKLDAVVTISNDIVPDPTYSPVSVSGQLTRSVSLFHVSWMQIFTHAQVLLSTGGIKDSDHRELLEEFIRFLSHKSTGIKGFTQMPAGWGSCVDKLRSGGKLQKRGSDELDVVNGWMQEERELSFILSQSTYGYCEVKRGRAESKDASHVVSKHLDMLVDKGELETRLLVKDASGPLLVKLNLLSRSLHISMSLNAPKDKSRATAVVNWLIRQLPSQQKHCEIVAGWPGKTPPTIESLDVVRENPSALTQQSQSILPHTLEVVRRFELGAKFNSRKGVIQVIEKEVERFYAEIGSNLVEWVPQPKPIQTYSVAEEIVEQTTYEED